MATHIESHFPTFIKKTLTNRMICKPIQGLYRQRKSIRKFGCIMNPVNSLSANSYQPVSIGRLTVMLNPLGQQVVIQIKHDSLLYKI